MVGKYFLISILIGALFYSCEKPTSYTLDNKKDPESKDYIPTEPDSFFVIKNADRVPNLVWRDNSEAESGFLIKKKIGNGEFNLVESTTPNQSHWIDESYKPSEPITYGIQSYNNNGESDLVVTSPLLSYLNVGLEVNGLGKVSLSNLLELPDTVVYGSEISLVAEPEICWDFASWNDKVFEPSNTYMVISDTTIKANFVKNTHGYEIQLNTIGQGEIILEPKKATYNCADIVQIAAIPSEGWEFSGWEFTDRFGFEYEPTDNPLSYGIGSALKIVAIFTELPTIPADGLVAWYPFNGNANDESGNGNHGTVNGATLTIDRNGNGNSAYNFDGIDDIIVLDGHEKSMEELTVSLWLKINEFPQNLVSGGGVTTATYSLVRKWGGTNQSRSYEIDIISNNNTTSSGYIMTCINAGCYSAGSYSDIPVLEWFNLVIVYGTNQIKTYINGLSVDVKDVIFTSINTSSSSSTIGRYLESNHTALNGQLDDIAYWNRALTEEEIQRIYNKSISSDPP